MTDDYIRNRITQLRIQKGVSEYQMSYDLGHSRGYVNNISSGKALPSMSEFLAICEYFRITPAEFFESENNNPTQLSGILVSLLQLNDEDLNLIEQLTDRLLKTK